MIRTVVIVYAFLNVALVSAFPKPAEIEGRENNQDSEDSCMTTGGPKPNAPCQFPFNYKGKLYDGCTSIDHTQKWCATEIGSNRSYIKEKWGNCNENCLATTDLRKCHQEKKELKEELCLMVDCNYPNANIVCPERCLKVKDVVDTKITEQDENPISEGCKKKAGDCYDTCSAVPTTCQELENMLGACASTCPSCVQEEVALLLGCSTIGITTQVKEVVDTKTVDQDENPISEDCKKKAGDCYDTCPALPTTCEELEDMLDTCASTCPSCVQEEVALIIGCSTTGITSPVKEVVDTKTTEQDENPISEGCKKKAGDCYDTCSALPTTCEELEDMLGACASTCPSCVQEEVALLIGCSTTAPGCPSGRFDIKRTCKESGDWCNDWAAINGCLDCSHCDSNDRRNGKCPEC